MAYYYYYYYYYYYSLSYRSCAPCKASSPDIHVVQCQYLEEALVWNELTTSEPVKIKEKN